MSLSTEGAVVTAEAVEKLLFSIHDIFSKLESLSPPHVIYIRPDTMHMLRSAEAMGYRLRRAHRDRRAVGKGFVMQERLEYLAKKKGKGRAT